MTRDIECLSSVVKANLGGEWWWNRYLIGKLPRYHVRRS